MVAPSNRLSVGCPVRMISILMVSTSITNPLSDLLGIDHEEWQKELAEHKTFFDSLGGVVPEELQEQREQLVARFAE